MKPGHAEKRRDENIENAYLPEVSIDMQIKRLAVGQTTGASISKLVLALIQSTAGGSFLNGKAASA